MSRKDTIIKNTIAYTIGNLGTKVLAYVMVLVYTHFISTSDLGYYDLILTTISLLQPLVMLMLDDGVYRWMIDPVQKDKKEIISTCLKLVNDSTIVAIAVFLIINSYFHFKFAGIIVFYFYTAMIYQLILNSVRGLGNSRLYAFSGILNSFVLLISEIIGLVFLHLGVEVLLISAVISNSVAIIFLYSRQKELHDCLRRPFNKELARDILHYSVPIIPNNISWWVVNSSDRYIILFFLGASFNGIYSISNKFPTVITTVTGIFYFSLQEIMIKEYGSPDRDEFYSNIFKKYYLLLYGLVLCGIPFTRFVIQVFVSSDYQSAWEYTGILYLSTVYSALSGLLGIGYQISRETGRSIRSTIFAAILNFVINIAMVKNFRLYAACVSTLIAYVFLLIIRIWHSKKYFTLRINWIEFIGIGVLCIVMMVITALVSNNIVLLVITGIMGLVFLLFNRSIIEPILRKVMRQ